MFVGRRRGLCVPLCPIPQGTNGEPVRVFPILSVFLLRLGVPGCSLT